MHACFYNILKKGKVPEIRPITPKPFAPGFVVDISANFWGS